MKRSHFLRLLLIVGGLTPFMKANEVKAGERCFELRTYHAAEGKLEALDQRFRQHTMGLFERHGMTNIAYWHPVENGGNKLIYLLSYPDTSAREASWNAFKGDPEWQKAKAASEEAGELVSKIDSVLLEKVDFSPEMKIEKGGSHSFEMRTYTATDGNLPRLLNRFKNHTIGLFSKHGMNHFGYFTVSEGQEGAGKTLIYFLYNDSKEKQEKAFISFREDPVWVAAKAASEKEAGGSLTIPDGVKSEFLEATDYSPVK